MIDTKALKEKVLDLAIRGQLVPQDPNDEPASVLLERIREQKQQLVKEGKLKAKDIKNDTIIFKGEDNLHYEKFQDGTVKCIENDIPFELSYGWNWERLGNLSSVIQYGLSDSAKTSGTHRLLRITDIQNGKVNWENVPFTTIEDEDSYLLEKGDIVFARTGATVGKSYLINDLPYPSVYASYLIRIRLLNGLSPKYLSLFFNSKCYWNQIIDKSVGSGQPNCNGTSLKNLFIPVPPTDEQLLIIEECKSLLKCISVIDEKKEELMSSVNLIRSKILDLAIRGQLVPQDPNDEPASVLLERIRSEKEELIKQGKIKGDKKESIIFKGEDNSYYEKINNLIICIDNKLPYTVPDKWRWCSLYDIAEIVMGSSPNGMTINSSNNGIEFHQGKIFFTNKYLGISDKTTSQPTKIAPANSVLLCVRAPVGEINISNREICIGRGLASIHPYNYINTEWLFYWLKTYKNNLNKKATGSTFVAITVDTVKNMLIPLPPLEEQSRILQAIDNIFLTIELIEKSLK